MQIFSSLRLWELLLDNKTCDWFSQTVINWSAFFKVIRAERGKWEKKCWIGWDIIMSSYFDVLNCFRNLVALYFLCERFPAKRAENIKRVKRFNIGGSWNIYFSWKKGKRNSISIRCLSELIYAVEWS